jgi:hypothetical protein
MRRNLLALTLATAALFAAGDAHAQFAGRWTLELGKWQSEAGADVEIRGPNSAVLELTMSGDSASGTYTTEGGAPPLSVRGKLAGDKLTLSGQRQMRRNINGEESTVDVTISFELTAAAGEVAGEMRLLSKDEPPVKRTVKGKAAS